MLKWFCEMLNVDLSGGYIDALILKISSALCCDVCAFHVSTLLEVTFFHDMVITWWSNLNENVAAEY